MEAKTSMDIIEQLIKLQQIDRKRDRCQKKLDQVPIKLKQHTDSIAAIESALAEQEQAGRVAKAESDRAELEVNTLEQRREKIKSQMNAPKLSNREYEVLQEELAGVLADINANSDQALKGLDKVSEAVTNVEQFEAELAKAQADYEGAREKLEGSLTDVRAELEKHDADRSEYLPQVEGIGLGIYERVRRKHGDALAAVEGTIDRATSRLGSDVHCAACYIAVTANDAVQVLGRKSIVQCKSCVRILYVP